MSPLKSRTCPQCFRKHGPAQRCLSIHPPEPRRSLTYGERPHSRRREIVVLIMDALKVGATLIHAAVVFFKN